MDRRFFDLSVRWWIVAAAVMAVALLAPLFVLDQFYTLEFAYAWAFAIALIGLNVLTGFSGQISLGNGAFMAIGAYVTAILYYKLGVPYGWTILPAGLVAGLAGYLFGFPALKLSGLYLALATFALALSTSPVIKNFGGLTNGHEGIVLPPVTDPFGLGLTNEQWLYYLTLVIGIVMFLFGRAMLAGATGRALRAIRDSETAAAASGISVAQFKTMAFGMSAFYAGIAGSLFATITAYVSPDSFDLPLSLSLLVGMVIGGLGTLAGPIVGAGFVVALPLLAQQFFRNKPDIAYGLILILLMFLLPQGILGGVRQLVGWIRRRSGAVVEPAAELADLGPAAPPHAAGRGTGGR